MTEEEKQNARDIAHGIDKLILEEMRETHPEYFKNIEEKARAYDEALEKARKRVATEPQDHTDAILKDIFPQLRDSDDERTRKEMIEKITNLACGCFISQEQKQKFIAYLEKQEQKPYGQRDECKDCQMNYAGSCKGACEMKRKEQKHAPDDLQKSFEAGQTSIVDNPERYGLCKKPTWNKEDKTMLNSLIWAVHMKSISPLDEMDDRGKYKRYEKFLTSLLERFGLEPEWEWSEEE